MSCISNEIEMHDNLLIPGPEYSGKVSLVNIIVVDAVAQCVARPSVGTPGRHAFDNVNLSLTVQRPN